MGVSPVFVSTTSSAQTVANQRAQTSVEQEAARLYSTLAPLSMNDRKEVFIGLTSELKSEVWKAHLRSYVSKHPELTEKQKEAVQSAIALVTPRLFEISEDSPEWQKNVDEPIQRLERKVLEVFSREAARELLTVLGGPEPKQANPVLIKKTSLKLKPISRGVQPDPTCTCSTRDDWCPQDYTCIPDPCARTWPCGTFFSRVCNGMCAYIIYVD